MKVLVNVEIKRYYYPGYDSEIEFLTEDEKLEHLECSGTENKFVEMDINKKDTFQNIMKFISDNKLIKLGKYDIATVLGWQTC